MKIVPRKILILQPGFIWGNPHKIAAQTMQTMTTTGFLWMSNDSRRLVGMWIPKTSDHLQEENKLTPREINIYTVFLK